MKGAGSFRDGFTGRSAPPAPGGLGTPTCPAAGTDRGQTGQGGGATGQGLTLARYLARLFCSEEWCFYFEGRSHILEAVETETEPVEAELRRFPDYSSRKQPTRFWFGFFFTSFQGF